MVILSINLNHDGAAILLRDGSIAGYVNTERFSRIKKHPGIRAEELDELLDQAGITLAEVDQVILVNHGINFPELEDRYGSDFSDTALDYQLHPDGRRVSIRGIDFPCLVNPDHFVCHSAAAYYFSPFDSALAFSYDPMGSGAYLGIGNRLTPLASPVNLAGLVYNEISIALGFGGVFGAGKTMGLAPYGGDAPPRLIAEVEELVGRGISRSNIADAVGRLLQLAEAEPLFLEEGSARWNARAAFLVQEFLETALNRELEHLFRLNNRNRLRNRPAVQLNLCLSGGTALNSVANQKCFAASKFLRLYLHPACGDDGTAIGAALYFWHHVLGNPKIPRSNREAMYSVRNHDASVAAALDRHASSLRRETRDDYLAEAARLIAEGRMIGWFQGASEIGPRALGNRSILCDPSRPGMKDTLNGRVKFRENFRPFAPSVLNEYAGEWFGLSDSPFMLRVASVLKEGVPAVTHYDTTARVQTVSPEDNPRYHALIEEFRRLTGIPMLLNTSFNIKGDPIVETPDDAIRSFLDCDLDHLVFPGFIVSKRSA